nr:MAG TPA: hypothetical protein [Bacteriophage sp.]
MLDVGIDVIIVIIKDIDQKDLIIVHLLKESED